MSNIIKKSFIGLTCLLVGIFLAIGATYVYATWNDAKTGGSGELSEVNWNALVSRLEAMDAKIDALGSGGGGGVIGPTAISAEAPSVYTHPNAATYCRDLTETADYAMPGTNSNGTTVYSDWRLPTYSELSVFEGISGATTNYLWTGTFGFEEGLWLTTRLTDGRNGAGVLTSTINVRCVR